MKIVKITVNNKISVHSFPEGDYTSQREVLKELIGPKCKLLQRVMPKRLYDELGASSKTGDCVIVLVDEDGERHGLTLNTVGSWLYETDKHGLSILGNILIIGERGNDGEEVYSGLTEEQYSLLYPKLQELTRFVCEMSRFVR